jgi:hypothetical protein
MPGLSTHRKGVFYDNYWLTITYMWVAEDEGGGDWIEILGPADLSDRNEALEPAMWSPAEGEEPFIISSNLSQNFTVTDDITLTFSKAISIADFELWEEDNWDEEDPIDFLMTWSGNTATINPDETLLIDTIYRVMYYVEATDGYTSVEPMGWPTFRTQRGIDKIGSNVEIFDDIDLDDFATDVPITINFNMAIDHFFDSDIALQDGDNNYIFITPTITTTTIPDDTLTITPSLDLEDNMSYTVSWEVFSDLDNGTDSDVGSIGFSTAEAALSQPDDVTNFDLADPLFEADWDTQSIAFEWDRAYDSNLDLVDGYYIFATDTYNGVEEVLVADIADPGPEDYSGTLTGSAILHDAGSSPFAVNVFDAWPDAAGDVQPFAQANAITFEIYAYVSDSAGDEILMSASAVASASGAITDTTDPSFAAPTALDPTSTPVIAPVEPLFGGAPYVAGADEVWTIGYTISEAIDPTFAVSVDETDFTGTSVPVVGWTWGPQTITITLDFTSGDDLDAASSLTITIQDTSGVNQRTTVFDF